MTTLSSFRIAAFSTIALIAAAVLAPSQVRAQEMLLPVPSVTIYPNEEIGDEHVTERAFIAATVTRGSVQEDRGQIIGKVAKRTLLKGQPIPSNALREPYLVLSGKPATVVFEDGGLSITSQATALQSGSVGDVIALRNVESGLTIRGTVTRNGTVRVGPQ
jgi:flagella basal body P-ring formation protein FlgA